MLPRCCPLPSNLSPSVCGVLWGTLSILRGQAAPRRGLPACGAACAGRHPSRLRSSLGPAKEGNLGLVLQIRMSPGERSSAHVPALPKPSPSVTLAAFPWDADARSTQLSEPRFPPQPCSGWPAPACCRAGSWPMGSFLAAARDGELSGVGGKSAASHLCRGSPPAGACRAAHPLKGKQGGLVWGLWVFSFCLPTQLREMKRLFAVAPPLFPYLLLFLHPCWGWGHVSGESLPGTGKPVWEFRPHLWPRSWFSSLGELPLPRSVSGSQVKGRLSLRFPAAALPLQSVWGSILQMLEETAAFFFLRIEVYYE